MVILVLLIFVPFVLLIVLRLLLVALVNPFDFLLWSSALLLAFVGFASSVSLQGRKTPVRRSPVTVVSHSLNG